MKKISLLAAMMILSILLSMGYAQDMAQNKFMPKKVEADTNYDSKVDRVEIYDTNGQISRIESDTNYDTVVDEWVTYKDGKPVKSEKDTNKDGKPDVFVEY